MSLRDTKISPSVMFFILGGVALVILLFLAYNQYTNLNEAQAQLEEEEQSLELASTRLDQLLELRERGPEFERYLETLEQLIPTQANEDALLDSLEKMASAHDLQLSQVRFDSREPADDYVEIPLQLAFQGEYSSFLKIMHQLQDLQEGSRAFRIEVISLNQNQMDLQVKTFYRD